MVCADASACTCIEVKWWVVGKARVCNADAWPGCCTSNVCRRQMRVWMVVVVTGGSGAGSDAGGDDDDDDDDDDDGWYAKTRRTRDLGTWRSVGSVGETVQYQRREKACSFQK